MSERSANALLRSLPQATFDRLVPHLVFLDLSLGEMPYRAGDKLDWVYFSEGARLSLLTINSDGRTVETGMAGNEGALGVVEALGSGLMMNTSTIVQVPGGVARAPARVFRDQAYADPDLLRRSIALIEAQLSESRQSALCQALHTVETRFARWILETVDRTGGLTRLPMTQDFLASMLGVERTTVSAFAARLQKVGLIQYSRGRLDVVDAQGLEHLACECRDITVTERRRLGLNAETHMTA